MKKVSTFATLAVVALMALSSCSGSDNCLLFGTIPSEYAELKAQRDKLEEEAKNVKTEEDKAKLIKKNQELDEKWAPKLEKAATALDGKEINITDSLIKVTSPISLTFEKLGSRNLDPIFKINGSAETAETITFENTFSQSRIVYIAGYDAAGNEVYKSQVGRISGEVKLNTLEIPAGTPVEFSTLTFSGSYVDKYPEAKTLKLIYL